MRYGKSDSCMNNNRSINFMQKRNTQRKWNRNAILNKIGDQLSRLRVMRNEFRFNFGIRNDISEAHVTESIDQWPTSSILESANKFPTIDCRFSCGLQSPLVLSMTNFHYSVATLQFEIIFARSYRIDEKNCIILEKKCILHTWVCSKISENNWWKKKLLHVGFGILIYCFFPIVSFSVQIF